jgi:hypothetical protein
MWICLNNAFVSVIKDTKVPENLLVRARAKKHLEALFPRLQITETPKRDYRWRVSVPAATMAALIAEKISDITYDNFKNSVQEKKLHDLYAGFWCDHRGYQEEACRPA